MDDFDHLTTLPGAPLEQAWLKERLETLSVRESYGLAAATMRRPPETASEAAECLRSLNDYTVCFPAGSYEQLGAFCLRQESQTPEAVLPYVDLDQLGQRYEDEHPGLFMGQCYVAYPPKPIDLSHEGTALSLPGDMDWSVKLKLASPAVPEGVWVRLPDYTGITGCDSVEVTLALDELKAGSLEECTLLDARCILPEAGDLMEQYDSIAELISDGNNLGFVMDEQGQGAVHWMERFAAALEYENCHTLRFALDISQNLRCYEWVSCEDLAEFASNRLREEGVSDELIHSGCIDLQGYGADLLESAGYMLTSGESGYIARNAREFIFEFTAAEQTGPEQETGPVMGLRS